MKELFNDFDKVSLPEWLTKIEQDLKGKPLSVLHSTPEPDLEIKAYSHADQLLEEHPDFDSHRTINKAANTWGIRKEISPDKHDNQIVLNALNEGITSLGISYLDAKSFEKLTKDVQFKYIDSDISFTSVEQAINAEIPKESKLNFDILALNAASGAQKFDMTDFLDFFKAKTANNNIWVSGDIYGNAGSSSSQELGYSIAHLNEYFHALKGEGVNLIEVLDKITISLSVGEDYFVNIAKFRAIHVLIKSLLKGYGIENESFSPTIFAKTSVRYLAKNDKNNNPLRQTSQAMSAVIGGCNQLTITVPEFGTPTEITRFERIAKNIQLILKEEAYLGLVVDPSGGSYYIESLTEQIINKAWTYFLAIEKVGGFESALKTNHIQNEILANRNRLISDLNANSRTFLGVNKHPNSMENWIELTVPNQPDSTDFIPVSPFYLENYFIKKQH